MPYVAELIKHIRGRIYETTYLVTLRSAITCGVLADPLDALAHVCEQHAVGIGPRSHNATASASTRSRSAGCRLASVTTSTRRPSSS